MRVLIIRSSRRALSWLLPLSCKRSSGRPVAVSSSLGSASSSASAATRPKSATRMRLPAAPRAVPLPRRDHGNDRPCVGPYRDPPWAGGGGKVSGASFWRGASVLWVTSVRPSLGSKNSGSKGMRTPPMERYWVYRLARRHDPLRTHALHEPRLPLGAGGWQDECVTKAIRSARSRLLGRGRRVRDREWTP